MFAFYYLQGNVTFSCSEPQIVPITFVSSSRSYLLLPGTPQIDGLSVSFQFRTWNKDGLLLSTELSEKSGSLLVYLHGGRLTLLIQKVTENPVEISEGTLFLFSFTHLSLKYKGSMPLEERIAKYRSTKSCFLFTIFFRTFQ